MRILFFAAIILFPALASAQSVEVFAMTGGVQVWDDEGNIGFGVPIGGGVGFKSPHGWGFELVAETQKAKRNFDSGVRFDSTITAGRARILKYFGDGRTQPYAGGGLGVTRVTSTRESPTGCARVNNMFTCTGRDVFRSESTAGTLSGFAGVRIPAGNGDVRAARSSISRGRASTLRIGGNVAVGASW